MTSIVERSMRHADTANLKPLKVLVIAPFPYGIDRGTPIRARRNVDLAMQAGATVTVVTYGADLPGDPAVIRGRLRARSMRQGFSMQKPLLDAVLIVDAIRVARRIRPDILHAHVHEGLAVALVARLFVRGGRIVYDAHGTLADELVLAKLFPTKSHRYKAARRFEQWLVRRADAVIAQSNHRAADLIRDGVEPQRVVVLPDCPEEALFDVGRTRGPDVSSDPTPVAVYTGSLEAYQGIDDILSAAALTTDIRFVLFGTPGAAYQKQVDACGLSSRVQIIDPAPFAALPELLSAADIALAPRRYGGNIPGKVPAYLAAGLPVIGTDVEGIRELVDESVGVIVPPGDVAALAGALQQLADDAHGRRARGATALERATDIYGRGTLTAALCSAYGRPQ